MSQLYWLEEAVLELIELVIRRDGEAHLSDVTGLGLANGTFTGEHHAMRRIIDPIAKRLVRSGRVRAVVGMMNTVGAARYAPGDLVEVNLRGDGNWTRAAFACYPKPFMGDGDTVPWRWPDSHISLYRTVFVQLPGFPESPMHLDESCVRPVTLLDLLAEI